MGKDLNGNELGVGYGQRKDDKRFYFRFTNRFGFRITLTANTYKEIQALARNALREDAQKKNLVKNMTVESLFEYWNEVYRLDEVKATTRRKHRGIYNRLIKNRWAKYSLRTIDTAFLKKEYAEILKISKRSSVESWVHLVKGMFTMAYEEEIIGRNPAINLKAPPRNTNEKIPLTDEELDTFLMYSMPSLYFNVFLLAANTGMRVGEIGGLQIQDIDFQARTLHVERQLHYIHIKDEADVNGDRFLVDNPKTPTSNRYIPLNDVAICALKNQLAQNKVILNSSEARRFSGDKYKNYVFLCKRGSPIHENICNHQIRRVISKINQKRSPDNQFRDFTMHVLRVTFASKCYEKNIDMKTIQNWLGHLNINTTMGIYVKKRVSDDVEKANEINTGANLVQIDSNNSY